MVKKLYKKKATKKTVTKKTKPSFVQKIVRKELARQIEDKFAYVQFTGVVNAYSINNSMNVASCIPYSAIVQGTGQSGRIGNRVKTASLHMNLVLYPNAYNVTSNPAPTPQCVIMMFGVVKNKTAQLPTATDFAKLWQTGNTSSAPSSSLMDLCQVVNNDFFTVRKILKFKIGYAAATGTGSTADGQYLANNDFKINVSRRINLTKICPKFIKFNDTTAEPTNDGLFMWVWCVNANGVPTNYNSPLNMQYEFAYTYEDA